MLTLLVGVAFAKGLAEMIHPLQFPRPLPFVCNGSGVSRVWLNRLVQIVLGAETEPSSSGLQLFEKQEPRPAMRLAAFRLTS